MFAVNEATAAEIRAVFLEHGELSAVLELRRHFPLITDIAQAKLCVRTIAGWKPISTLKRLRNKGKKDNLAHP